MNIKISSSSDNWWLKRELGGQPGETGLPPGHFGGPRLSLCLQGTRACEDMELDPCFPP